jgi:serine/threonine protein kinase
MHEAQMCEMIKRSPHRNVVKYFGCLVDEDGRISELCFARYRKTLNQMVKDGEIFDRKACLGDIRAGIEHLHSLGMIHCDINPHNVFTDVKDFVIGDFDSCTLEGDELGAKAGTDGWTSDDFVLARRENDWFGFAKIEQFLFPPKDH